LARPVFKQFLLATIALATINYTAGGILPVLRGREPIGERLLQNTIAWRDTVLARAPWIHADSSAAMDSPQFDADKLAFAEDLMRTGQVDQKRADSLASVAVHEAYIRRVPPALVLGVMLTENSVLKSSARSNVGAVGLMQVHPRPWRSLRSRFGSNLRDDKTNLKTGVFILGYLLRKPAKDSASTTESWRLGLLRYNGCVTGSNTPSCHSYPDVVRKHVEQVAQSSCAGASFGRCVAQPLILSARRAALLRAAE
jgi:transglycosylase-like protein with SLT domain